MSGSDLQDAQQKYANAREKLRSGRDALAEGHRMLRELSTSITHARTRGQINQQIWDCERLNGRRGRFFSQSGQDAFLDERVFRGKRDGVFVEIGGYDGITGSNCLFFELMRGWSGLLIEPSPTYYAEASAFRRATCLQCAVAAREGQAEFLDVTDGFSQMGGLTATYDPKLRQTVEANPRHKGDLISVKTHTLRQILDQHFLKTVDYISLDVEGGEMSVLSGFPFETYDVTAWSIENNAASMEIPELMRDKGYNRIEALGVDDVYVKGAP